MSESTDKGEKEEELKLITFGSEKLKVIKTKSTNLSIKLNNGKYLNICANIVPVVSGNVQRKSMDSASIEHLRSFIKEADLADDIPVKNESSGFVGTLESTLVNTLEFVMFFPYVRINRLDSLLSL
jgi:hypothetical protein